jgi:hypothetical protein
MASQRYNALYYRCHRISIGIGIPIRPHASPLAAIYGSFGHYCRIWIAESEFSGVRLEPPIKREHRRSRTADDG